MSWTSPDVAYHTSDFRLTERNVTVGRRCCEESQVGIKGKVKANQKITSGYLVDIYELKGGTKKSAEYAKMRDAY